MSMPTTCRDFGECVDQFMLSNFILLVLKSFAIAKMARFMWTVFLSLAYCISVVKCSSFYFGARRAGDAIIMRDVLHTNPSDFPISHTIKFSYPIIKQIVTFIEVSSRSVRLT